MTDVGYIDSDQFCSLVFTLSNFYFVGCVYADGFPADWRQKCGSASKYWPVGFAVATLPFIVRVVQSVKRYVDSRLNTHLINVGSFFLMSDERS